MDRKLAKEKEKGKGKARQKRTHSTLYVNRLFFFSPLTGPVKNVLSTLCIRVWSPGARAGYA